MARIYARQIYAGKMALDDVPGRWKASTVEAYKELYGEDI